MNLSDCPRFLRQAWHSHPDARRLGTALTAYLLVVGLMGAAATLISTEMPFFDSMASI